MDMAGFAINIRAFLAKAGVKMGFKDIKGHKLPVKDGHLETDYLENFASRQTVECRGSDKEVSSPVHSPVHNPVHSPVHSPVQFIVQSIVQSSP